MTFLIQRWTLTKADQRGKKTGHTRLSFPPESINADRYLAGMDVEKLSKTPSAQLRKLLRERMKLPMRSKQGLPYAYRLYSIGGKDSARTLFPKTKTGEKISIHGRLDYDAIIRARAQLQQSSNE